MSEEEVFKKKQWVGYTHDNPDMDANPHLAKIVDPNSTKGWGALVTPDDIRYTYMYGNSRLVTMNGQYMTDSMLKGWIDQTVEGVSGELQHDIYPTLWRHRNYSASVKRPIEAHAKWEDPYDYKNTDFQNNFHLVLRHRPVVEVLNWKFVNPMSDTEIIDLMKNAVIQHDMGTLRSLVYGSGMKGNAAIRSGQRFYQGTPQISVPGSFYVDYISGYDHASRVPADIRRIAGMLCGYLVMWAYSSGIAGGIANFSISAGVISESVGTTTSATSSFMGSSMIELQNEIKRAYAECMQKYKPIRMALL